MKRKSELKRFLINRFVKYITWALILVPVLYMFMERVNGTNHIYQYAIPIIIFVTPFMLATGKSEKINNKKITHRNKYRYFFLFTIYFICTLLNSLLDFYYYDKDYLSYMIFYNCFYIMICAPVVIARTYYSRCLDLLDYIYRNFEEDFIKPIIGIVAGFYVVALGSLFIITCLGLNKVVFSSHIIDGYELIFISIMEFVLFLVGYFLYVLYKKKHNKYIWYR